MKQAHSEIIPRLYMKLLPIQIILVFIGGANAISDNAFAANLLNQDAMAVTGLFGPVSNLLNAVNVLFFSGAQVLCGRYLGKHMSERTNSVFTLDMEAIVLVSFLLTGFCVLAPGPVTSLLGASPALAGDLAAYIRGYAAGLPFFCMGTQLTAFLQLEQQEKRSYAAILVMFASNVLLNWLFIGVLKMGLFGLGLATSAANFLFFLIQALHYFSGKSAIRLVPRNVIVSDLKDILLNGFPGAASQACIFLRGILLNRIIAASVGQHGLEAFSAVNSFGCIYWAVPAGVTSAVMVLGSVYAGEEDRAGLYTLMKSFLRYGLTLVIFVSLALSASCVPLTRIFFRDPASPVYPMALHGFLLFPFSSILSAFTVGFSNYYHCLGQEKIVRTISFMDGIVFIILLALLLIPHFGMDGMWTAQILSCLLCALLIYAYAAIRNRKVLCTLSDAMCFPADFGVSAENRMDLSIHSLEEATEVSRAVWKFCDERGVDPFRRYCASICLEEMACNIVKHGFSADQKKHRLDLRVSLVRDEIRLNLKDDCISFNPVEASKLFDPEDKTHNIGLRIAGKISKSIQYQNTFGLNIVTIII